MPAQTDSRRGHRAGGKVIEQLSAVFRTPTLVAKTYFAARGIEQAERDRLFKQKAQLEMELSQAREQALELMKPGSDQSGKTEMLTTVNRQAVELLKQLTHVSERCKAYQGNSITEQDVSEAFQNVEGFWKDLSRWGEIGSSASWWIRSRSARPESTWS